MVELTTETPKTALQLTSTAVMPLIDTSVSVGGADRVVVATIAEMVKYGSGINGPRNVRPAEYFGAVGVDFGNTTVNNLTALQAAIDWSSATGGTVVLGYGDYGFDGTLVLKSNMILVGQGGTVGHTVLSQKNTSWPNCLASVVSTSATTGVSNIVLCGFCVDGGWDLKNSFNTGANWDYLLTSKTQRGIFVDSPDNGADSLNRTASPDSNNRMVDLWVRSVAGTGIYLDGRGEMMLQHLRVSKCAVDGLILVSPDNWMSDITTNTIGARGFVLSAGNQRVQNIKSWFIGMCKGEEVSGIGVTFAEGAGNTNVDGTNITTQDTWGPGLFVEGSLITVQGRVDEAGGGRLQQQGNGFQGTRTKDRTAVEIGNLKNGRVNVAINGQNRSLSSLPHAVSFRDSGADQTYVTIQIDRHAAAYLHTTLIEAVAGLATSKRHNVVHEADGGILYGERTAAELGDALHSVNVDKFKRQEVWDSTNNRKLFANGTTATDVWRTSDGTSVITPA